MNRSVCKLLLLGLVFPLVTLSCSTSIPVDTPTTLPRAVPNVAATKPSEFHDNAEPLAVHDPTFAEMIAFLNSNKVNWQGYGEDYACVDFACDLQREAIEKGIRCAFVGIDYPVNGHAIVAFETTDKGLVYIEPQLDLPVKVEVGTKYATWLYGSNYVIDYDDTVTRIILKWNRSYCDLVSP